MNAGAPRCKRNSVSLSVRLRHLYTTPYIGLVCLGHVIIARFPCLQLDIVSHIHVCVPNPSGDQKPQLLTNNVITILLSMHLRGHAFGRGLWQSPLDSFPALWNRYTIKPITELGTMGAPFSSEPNTPLERGVPPFAMGHTLSRLRTSVLAYALEWTT